MPREEGLQDLVGQERVAVGAAAIDVGIKAQQVGEAVSPADHEVHKGPALGQGLPVGVGDGPLIAELLGGGLEFNDHEGQGHFAAQRIDATPEIIE